MIYTPTHVMVVDDEKDFNEMLAESLKEMDFSVLSAFSGKQCLALMEDNPVDVIVLDIKMPEMDGIETLTRVKKNFPLVEIIMLTGHGTIESAVKGMKLGAYDYLLKPADFEELVQKIKGARTRRDEHEERIRAAEAQMLKIQSRKGGRSPLGA